MQNSLWRYARCRITALVVLGVAVCAGPPHAVAVDLTLDRPGDREFVRDRAGLISESDEAKIRGICDRLLSETATPIVVVTIDSMADHGGDGLRIETFATLLFDQWGIGVAEINGQDWNTGILLLVSRRDRKARIELGGGWGRREDQLCREIMDDQIIANFKRQRFSEGILAGVESLSNMARKEELPRAPRPAWFLPAVLLTIGLAIFTVVSLVRSGSGGLAWLFWGGVFTLIFLLLRNAGSSDGGSYSGGSFGGGSSGGGGASGSW
ncbi:MAG: TPM domain-containing protein [Planctomycetaceae bacterium]|nr:TPM domain-containing protein [Planctomycetaceae bacterium]